MDDVLVDPIIGVDGHLDGFKVHAHEDSIFIELESNFWSYSSLQSSGMQAYCLNPQIHKVNSEVLINGCIPLDWRLLVIQKLDSSSIDMLSPWACTLIILS